MHRSNARILLLASAAAAALPSLAPAATFTKDNNPLLLNNPLSWLPNGLPGSADTALFDATITSPLSFSLGSSLAWRTLQLTNPASDISFLNDGNTLTLGSSSLTTTSIDMSAATRNLTLNNNLNLLGKTTAIVATTLTLAGNHTYVALTKTGDGTLVLGGTFVPPAIGSPSIGIDAGTGRLASSAALYNATVQFSVTGTSSTFDLAGYNASVGRLMGRSFITNSAPAAVTFTIAPNSSSFTSSFSGIISNGSGTLGLMKAGAGSLTVSGANTYTGPTTIVHGSLFLDFSLTNQNIISLGSQLQLAGGDLVQVGYATHNASQTLLSTLVSAGDSRIIQTGATASALTLLLSTIARPNPGATLNIIPLSANPNARIFTSNSLTPSGILGGWALYNTNDWATRPPADLSSALAPLSSYDATLAPAKNTSLAANASFSPNGSTASLRFTAANTTLTLSGANTIESGGILLTTAASNITINAPTASDTLTSGGPDLILHQNSFSTLTINAAIVDNGAAAVAITKSGLGTVVLGNANTYTGGTFLNNGILTVAAGASLGTGPVYVNRAYPPPQGFLILTQLRLPAGISFPNDILLRNDDTIFSNGFLDIPTASSATLTGNIATAPDPLNQYRLSISSGTLTLTGAHTSGTPGGPGVGSAPLYTMFWGNSRTNSYNTPPLAHFLFTGSSSLTSYQAPIQLSYADVILKDNATFTVLDLPSGTGFAMALPGTFANYPSQNFLTLQDNAHLNIGALDFDLLNTVGTLSTLNFNGGTLSLGRFIKSGIQGSIALNFNGTTLVANTDTSSFLPAFQALNTMIFLNGARVDTNGHAITIAAALKTNPALNPLPDGGLTKSGPGILTLTSSAHTFTGTLTIQQGTVRLAATSVKLHSLALAHNPDSSFASTLDLTTTKTVLQLADPAAQLPTLRAALASANANNTWTGPGITSSAAAADPAHLTVALYNNADLHLTSFGGQTVDETSLVFSLAPLGDATGDNKVDALDLTILASHWLQPSGATTSSGDFTFDGKVDTLDLTALASNWQSSLSLQAALAASGFQTLTPEVPAPVPEPASLLLILPALLLARQKAPGRRSASRTAPAR